MNNGWISVKERLPESYDTVLICAYSEENDNYGYTTGNYFDLAVDNLVDHLVNIIAKPHEYVYIDDDAGWCFDNEILADEGYKAVAWMPIPQYKEESK